MKTIIVTGSVRCGSSLVMRMLESCGVPVIADGHKQPDEGNPYGYYETRQVYSLNRGDMSVLEGTEGKALKVLPPTLLRHMPTDREFKTIFLMRDPQEVGVSFYKYHKRVSIERRQPLLQTQEEYLSHFIPDHLQRIIAAKEWVNTHSNFDVLWIEHNSLMNTPLTETTRICDFLSQEFPQYTFDAQAMASLVNLNLYRERQANPHL
jgi:hypothetical protein